MSIVVTVLVFAATVALIAGAIIWLSFLYERMLTKRRTRLNYLQRYRDRIHIQDKELIKQVEEKNALCEALQCQRRITFDANSQVDLLRRNMDRIQDIIDETS